MSESRNFGVGPRNQRRWVRSIPLMTVIVAGLLPILLSTGTGADVMKRIATPMVGGVVTSVLSDSF